MPTIGGRVRKPEACQCRRRGRFRLSASTTFVRRDLNLDPAPRLPPELDDDVEAARLDDAGRSLDDLDGVPSQRQRAPGFGELVIELGKEVIDITADEPVHVLGRARGRAGKPMLQQSTALEQEERLAGCVQGSL